VAARRQPDESRASVRRIRDALDVAPALEIADELRHRLRRHAGAARELAGPVAFHVDRAEDADGVGGTDVVEARGRQRGVHRFDERVEDVAEEHDRRAVGIRV
jgi:hypothetical protein